MPIQPLQARIMAVATAHPPHTIAQDFALDQLRERLLGPDWRERPELAAQGRQMERLFTASGVRQRQTVVPLPDYYHSPRTTGERMADYPELAYGLGREALDACLAKTDGRVSATDINDLLLISCTGYSAPGLDIQLARDLEMPRDVRRLMIGHMGCFAGVIGLRQSLAAVRAHPEATVAMLAVELSSLHFAVTLDFERLTALSLFGDAAGAVVLRAADEEPEASGPIVVDSYCFSDFTTSGQMSWKIGDEGFVIGLSPRVPITLRRNIRGALECLLSPHGLTERDITHWVVHPGGPSILDAIQGKLELSDEQMALSRQVLAEHGNCSSVTVLIILERLLREGRAKPGEWGVMMAFGPGLTIETCLLRF